MKKSEVKKLDKAVKRVEKKAKKLAKVQAPIVTAADAYKALQKAATLGCIHVPDRFGSYAEYYVKWNRKRGMAILEELLDTNR